jgi:hypothetical protein
MRRISMLVCGMRHCMSCDNYATWWKLDAGLDSTILSRTHGTRITSSLLLLLRMHHLHTVDKNATPTNSLFL